MKRKMISEDIQVLHKYLSCASFLSLYRRCCCCCFNPFFYFHRCNISLAYIMFLFVLYFIFFHYSFVSHSAEKCWYMHKNIQIKLINTVDIMVNERMDGKRRKKKTHKRSNKWGKKGRNQIFIMKTILKIFKWNESKRKTENWFVCTQSVCDLFHSQSCLFLFIIFFLLFFWRNIGITFVVVS